MSPAHTTLARHHAGQAAIPARRERAHHLQHRPAHPSVAHLAELEIGDPAVRSLDFEVRGTVRVDDWNSGRVFHQRRNFVAIDLNCRRLFLCFQSHSAPAHIDTHTGPIHVPGVSWHKYGNYACNLTSRKFVEPPCCDNVIRSRAPAVDAVPLNRLPSLHPLSLSSGGQSGPARRPDASEPVRTQSRSLELEAPIAISSSSNHLDLPIGSARAPLALSPRPADVVHLRQPGISFPSSGHLPLPCGVPKDPTDRCGRQPSGLVSSCRCVGVGTCPNRAHRGVAAPRRLGTRWFLFLNSASRCSPSPSTSASLRPNGSAAFSAARPRRRTDTSAVAAARLGANSQRRSTDRRHSSTGRAV